MNKLKRNEEIYNEFKQNNTSTEKLGEMYGLSMCRIKEILYQMECREYGIPCYGIKINKNHVYPNIEKERALEGYSCVELAKLMGIGYQVLSLKLYGKTEFSLNQALKLKEVLKSELSIEELFKRSDQ